MNLNKFYKWFHDYYKNYYSQDQIIMDMVNLKENHSLRVAKISRELAVNLKLEDYELDFAELVGLLHDIARCEQAHYKTFRDTPSFDHGDIGAIRLQEADILDSLGSEEKAAVIFSVKYHNKRVVPPSSPKEKLFANILRDSDKVDIFKYVKVPQSDNSYSPDLVKYLIKGEVAPYEKVKTCGDWSLIRLGWFYDINYHWTLSKLLQEGYAESLLASIPSGGKFAEVKDTFGRFVEESFREVRNSEPHKKPLS